MSEMKRINSKKIAINFKLKKILALSEYSKIPILGKRNKMFMNWAT